MDNNDISHLVDYTFTLHINTCYVSYDESEVMILMMISKNHEKNSPTRKS